MVTVVNRSYFNLVYLFPMLLQVDILPIEAYRFYVGGIIEKGIVFSGLILLNMYIFYTYHQHIIDFLKHSIR